jgi:hypothetical protein
MNIQQTVALILTAAIFAFGITAAPALTKSGYAIPPSHTWSQPANFSSFGGSIEPVLY